MRLRREGATWRRYVCAHLLSDPRRFCAFLTPRHANGPLSRKYRTQVHLRLGDVSMANSQYPRAIEDFQKCLALQTELLRPQPDREHRPLADAHFQIAIASIYQARAEEAKIEAADPQNPPGGVPPPVLKAQSLKHYEAAAGVFERMIADLEKVIAVTAANGGEGKENALAAGADNGKPLGQDKGKGKGKATSEGGGGGEGGDAALALAEQRKEVAELKEILDEVRENIAEMRSGKNEQAVQLQHEGKPTTTIGFGQQDSSSSSASASAAASSSAFGTPSVNAVAASSAAPVMLQVKKRKAPEAVGQVEVKKTKD